ncbi:MAG TPA: serine hydrolase domain-containing protein [Pyrinomonadaceae bacterium]|nr:serine hydrolase domain-containing protein [Pyrinomonadaceae bacterium]
MQKIRSNFAILIIVALAITTFGQELPKAKPELVGMSAAKLSQLSSVLDGYVNEGRLPGGVAMVLRKGKVAYVHSFGKSDREANSPMAEDTIFRIASQSKALTSVAIMMLQEDGKLLVSDNLSKYIPEFANSTVAVPKDGGGYDVVKAKRQITIRDLLTHTSGISYGFGPAKDKWEAAKIQNWYFADRDEPIGETVKRMAALPMDAHPGEKYIYGYSTDILGVVVEKASGKTLEEFLNERILKPLDMKDTSFYLPTNKTERLAAVFSVKDGKLERAAQPGLGVGQGHYINGPRKSFSGGAGLLSTARDYGRFLQMLANGGELNGKRLISRKSVEQMTSDQLRDIKYSAAGQGFGLGFSVVKDVGAYGSPSSVGEFGWGGAYHSNYWVNPQEQLVVVYMTQVIPATGLDDYGKLRAMIYSSLID